MSPKEMFYSVESLNCEIFNLKSFAYILILFYFLHVWIRIRIQNTDLDPEGFCIRIQYGSNTDPDPQHSAK